MRKDREEYKNDIVSFAKLGNRFSQLSEEI